MDPAGRCARHLVQGPGAQPLRLHRVVRRGAAQPSADERALARCAGHGPVRLGPDGHVRRHRRRAPPRHHDPARRACLRRECGPATAHPRPLGEQRRHHAPAAPHRPGPGPRARGHRCACSVPALGILAAWLASSRLGFADWLGLTGPFDLPLLPVLARPSPPWPAPSSPRSLPARRLGRLDIVGRDEGAERLPPPEQGGLPHRSRARRASAALAVISLAALAGSHRQGRRRGQDRRRHHRARRRRRDARRR